MNAFSEADPKSDQFSLGALLGHLLAGQPLFADTVAYMKKGRLDARPGDFNGLIPGELDRAVERMLARRAPDRFPTLDDALAAVERAAAPRRPPRRVEPPRSPDNLAPGLRIGDFDVVRKLGDGGLAVVYSAILRATGELRALKVARDNENARNALLREHRILRRLEHPGIVTVLDPSETLIPGRLVLVMEQVEGRTLRQWLYGDPQAPADVNTRHPFAEDLLAVLEYFEREGVVHNDLKPDNLLVGKGGLRVIDFSLAENCAGSSDPDKVRTVLQGLGKDWAAVVDLAGDFLGPSASLGRHNRDQPKKEP